MSWISNVVRPKIRNLLAKREVPQNLWIKCPETGEMVFHRDLEANHFVIPGSGFHMRMTASQRFSHFFDGGGWETIALPEVPLDPLKFRDERRYTDRLRDARDEDRPRRCGPCRRRVGGGRPGRRRGAGFRLHGRLARHGRGRGDRHRHGDRRRSAAGRSSSLLRRAARACRRACFSLMQLPRTTCAVEELRAAKLPYIVVLTNPTTGGVTASYAMLGDVHLAEPGALIGFAGPRVIEQTIREKLPEGFQRAEYLRDHGMVDLVVHRHKLRETIARLCRLLGAAAITRERETLPALLEPVEA